MKLLTASPVCCPDDGPEEAASFFQELGYRQVEIFSTWTGAKFDSSLEPAQFRAIWERRNLTIVSYHLPHVKAGDPASLHAALDQLAIAEALGSAIAIFKADTLDTLIHHLPEALEDAKSHGIRLVVQNHRGSCLETLDDYARIFASVADPALGAVLEVGHFAGVGISWEDAYPELRERIALVHLKDMRDRQPCRWGEGEVDFPALFACLRADNYTGTCVVEYEGPEERPVGMRQTTAYLRELLGDEAFA